MNTQHLSPITFEDGLQSFLRSLDGANKSASTIAAYRTDIHQFIEWLADNNCVVTHPANVSKADIVEYLAALADKQISGLSRARKLAALREYFKHLVDRGAVATSPATTVPTPKKEKKEITVLTRSEYTELLALAGGNVRDFAMLQVFLQAGLRVSELAALRIDDVDLATRELQVHMGKGSKSRIVELEKKAAGAIKRYLAVRPPTGYPELFLNQYGEPFSRQGIAKLVKKYLVAAGIKKAASVHSLRHTFATHKAMRGASPYRLRDWLGRANLNTTQLYVHLGRETARREMELTSL